MIALMFMISSIAFFYGILAGVGEITVPHSVIGATLTFLICYTAVHLVPEIS